MGLSTKQKVPVWTSNSIDWEILLYNTSIVNCVWNLDHTGIDLGQDSKLKLEQKSGLCYTLSASEYVSAGFSQLEHRARLTFRIDLDYFYEYMLISVAGEEYIVK